MGTVAVSAAAQAVANRTYAASQEELSIHMSGYDYDRVKGLIEGSIEIEGYDHAFEVDTIGGLNTNALGGPMTREVTELGMVPYILAYANEDQQNHTLIPVFPLRVFRHKSVFIRPDRGINKPEDLKGKTIATPGYSSTSLTWIRGFMQDEYGVTPQDVHWVVAREDSSGEDSGGPSRFENILPEGLTISEGPEGMDESDLLVNGEVDALYHAAEPKAFINGDPHCVRLFPDSRKIEQEYFRKTGIFPIMHAVAIRKVVAEAHPELPEAVFRAYSAAKKQVYDFQRNHAWYKTTMPWISQELEETRGVMGDNFYSYGLTDNNRKTLETLFQYSYEQGLASRRLTIEELFHPSTLELIE
jgi:4,5-dihydroxyphthalate decarboxylase